MSGIDVKLCNDDKGLLRSGEKLHSNVDLGICAGPNDWDGLPPVEECGCCIMIDPFTVNESCSFGCKFCYAADKSLAPKKRNTTRSLPVVR